MKSLFLQRELATVVFVEDGLVVIEQYEDNTPDHLMSVVRLTEHQFLEICKHEKSIREMLAGGSDQ